MNMSLIERIRYTERLMEIANNFARVYDRKITELKGNPLCRFRAGIDQALLVSTATLIDNGIAVMERR